jgi:hypothetical protein
MDHPYVLGDLYGVNHAVRIAPKRQGNLENARSHAVHGLRNVGLAALCCDRQSGKTDRPRPSGNVSNSFRAAEIHETGRVFRVILAVRYIIPVLQCRLSYVTTLVKSPPDRPNSLSRPERQTGVALGWVELDSHALR